MTTEAGSTVEPHSGWEWRVTAVVAVAAFVFGFAGMWKYECAAHPTGGVDLWSVFYHTLQLFILHAPHLENHVPWQLHVGRLLGAVPLCVAAVMAFFQVFPDEWNLIMLRLPWTRAHVVICGLGDVGQRLAIQGRQRKKRIVAIEKSCPSSTRQLMREQGVLVFDGDATDEGQLRAARVDRAEFVVASGPDDQTNVAIAATVARAFEPAGDRAAPLVCRTLIGNPDTRHVLSRQPLFSANPARYRVNFSDLDQHAVAARQALRLYPLDFQPIGQHDATVVRLVVIGFRAAGQGLALHAAQIGHFTNEIGRGKRLRLSVVDSTGASVAEFKARYPNLERVCDFESLGLRQSTSDLVPALAELCPTDEPASALVTYAFCWEDPLGDERNFRFGMELLQRVEGRAAQILIRQNSRKGFAELLSSGLNDAAATSRVHPFGMVEDVFSWDVLLHESEDKLARALHEDFRARNPDQPNPGWDELSEEFRDSNRRAADHIPIKLRALGYHQEQVTKEKARILGFSEPEIDLLARMEHARWCGERYLSGWTYGEKTDRAEKINRNLTEWDQLPREEKKKDPDQINAISSALDSIGVGIYR